MMAIVGPAPAPGIVARNAVASPPTPALDARAVFLEEFREPGVRFSSLNASSGDS